MQPASYCVEATIDALRQPRLELSTAPWPLPNVWIGVSVEDQQRADERIPHLLRCPAVVRFLSCEPLLGPVTLDPAVLGCKGHLAESYGNPLINWVIVGGESGPGARPMNLAWARSIVQQCKAAGVPVFCKQLGARPVVRATNDGTMPLDHRETEALPLRDRKGGDPEEWPADLRVREFPEAQP